MKQHQSIARATPVIPDIFQPAPSGDASPPPRYETPHARLGACQPDPGLSRTLSDDEILALNTYDFMAYLGKSVINPGGLKGREQLLAVLNPRRGTRILEIGCGTGHAACHIARRYHSHVTAIDVSPAMIQSATRHVQSERLQAHVQCELADVTRMPFPDGSFDYVISQAVLMFVDKPRALGEIRRVLRRGGGFAGLEFSWKTSPPEEVRQTTYQICGCRTLEFHGTREWGQKLRLAGLDRVKSQEHRFTMLSLPGFMHDEGALNTLRIMRRLLARRANLRRMREIWKHFARHSAYFSYSVLSASRLS
ncbi:MAG: methyltransferase domain-containing protein [Sulfuricaulis sp.]